MSEKFYVGLAFVVLVMLSIVFYEPAAGQGPVNRPAGTPAATTNGITLDRPDSGITLTAEEYEQFKQLVKIGRAPALQVASVTGAAVGMVILLAGTAYILFLVLMRYVFNRWFDQDVYHKTWPSTLVICVMILGAVIVLAAAVMR